MHLPVPTRTLGAKQLGSALALLCALAGCAKVGGEGVSDGAAGSGDVRVPGSGGAGSGGAGSGGASGAGGNGPRDAGAVETAASCVNLQCRQATCPGGAQTSISGTAFAPNGTLPLFNVIVYVPNAPLDPFPAGITCDRCAAVASGKPIASAVTDSQGKFKINNVPAGANIPLVLQVGKWRRKVTVPNVTACQDNALTDANLTRLPRNRQEGDMPRIAVTAGACDQLGCLLPKLGIDAAELGVAGQDRAVAYYRGALPIMEPPGTVNNFGPPNMPHATELWNDETKLGQHDLTLLSCECTEALSIKSAAAFAAMTNYLAKGGRIFGSHYSYVWLKHTPDMDLTRAVPIIDNPAFGPPLGFGTSPMSIDTSFPKGKALADWMQFLDPAIAYGRITSSQVFANVRSVMAPSALAWASSPTLSPGAVDAGSGNLGPRIVTVNTPAGLAADKQCGRAAFLDAHITTTDTPLPANAKFPQSCGVNLTKGEEALAFLFFDLASCIQDDTMPVVPPIIVQ